MTDSLEAHIVLELEKWPRGRDLDEDDEEWDYSKYDHPFIEFGPRTEVSCGRLESLEIHKGNMTEAYVEERRFKPAKLLILAVPNPTKEKWPKNHCNHVDFHTYALYLHPDGTWYSDWHITAQDGQRREVPVHVPFEYEVRDLLPVSKANKLLKRNPEVLKEITDRIATLEAMRDKISEHGITSDLSE